MTESTSPHLDDRLSAYLDGEVDVDEAHAIRVHLEGCARCRAELADVQAARSAVRALPMLEIPPGLLPTDQKGSPLLRRRRVLAWAAAVAAAVAVTFGLFGSQNGPSPLVVELDDLAATYEARVSLEPVANPAKLAGILELIAAEVDR